MEVLITQNQLMLQSNRLTEDRNRITEEYNKELVKYNEGVLANQAESNAINARAQEEAARHNKEIEEYNKEVLDLNAQIAAETQRHNERMEDIQERYNEAYLEWQRAYGEEKLAIEERLAALEEEKLRYDKWYKDFMADLEAQRVTAEKKLKGAQTAYYETLAGSESEGKKGVLLMEAETKQFMAQTERYAARMKAVNDAANAATNRLDAMNRYELGLLNAQNETNKTHIQYINAINNYRDTLTNEMRVLQSRYEYLDSGAERVKEETTASKWKRWTDAIWGFVKAATGIGGVAQAAAGLGAHAISSALF